MPGTEAAYRSVWQHLMDVPHRIDFVDAGGVRTRYLAAGPIDAPVVVMLHGATGSLEYFCANIGSLAESFRVIALDMLGPGATERPDHPYTPSAYRDHVIVALEALGIKRCSLFGVALGSAIAVHVAHRRPDLARALVLVSPGAIQVDEGQVRDFIAGVKERRGAAVDDLSWDNVAKVVDALFFDPETSRMDDLVALRLRGYDAPDRAAHMRNMLSSAQPEQFLPHDVWRAMDLPILVIAPVSIKHMFLDNARAIAALAPRAELVEMTDCRVWPQYEQPEVFNTHCVDFLFRHGGPDAG